MAKLVWTADKLSYNPQGCLNKLLMLLQINKNPSLTLVIRGDNSETLLIKALSTLPEADLIPLAFLVGQQTGAKSYYSAAEGGTKDNGLKTLKDALGREVRNRGFNDADGVRFALTYTKYCMSRGKTYALGDSVSDAKLGVAVRDLITYALDSSELYVRLACNCVSVYKIAQYTPFDSLTQLVVLILKNQGVQRPYGEPGYSSYLLGALVKQLRENKQPVPPGVLEYGIRQLVYTTSDELEKNALQTLVDCYREHHK